MPESLDCYYMSTVVLLLRSIVKFLLTLLGGDLATDSVTLGYVFAVGG